MTLSFRGRGGQNNSNFEKGKWQGVVRYFFDKSPLWVANLFLLSFFPGSEDRLQDVKRFSNSPVYERVVLVENVFIE